MTFLPQNFDLDIQSFGVATAVIVAFSMGWVTALVRVNHQLPDFGGLVLLIGALYGVNKVAGAVGSRMDDRPK